MSRQHYQAKTFRARDSIGYLVKRASTLCLDHVEPAFAEQGFTFTQWKVLMSLRDGLAVNAKDMCAQLRHDSGALTRVIDQLEARGLIERRRSTEDRRAVELYITAAGRRTVESLIPLVVEKLNYALRDFNAGEVAELKRLLNKLIDSIERAEADAVGASS